MKTNQYVVVILEELQQAAERLDAGQADLIVDQILASQKVFLAGAGRSGLMAKAFAMRLMHLGIDAYVVGETITPNVTTNDMLIIGSGSGETRSLLSMAEKAKSLQASVAVVTIFPESSIGQLADITVKLSGSPKDNSNSHYSTIQPMGSLFEQTLLLFFDAVILRLMEKKGYDSTTMFGKHANLE
ncbi:6-phospho-3-hexuloisomerase [Paenibacillus aceris]|uniref:6-phospho-3-hexuloisomerase n=1 Tax=Paenibacillus aceris TaxID=869555 RepID=A0ABS4I8A2_9BACL|nr:6-phospho-3-hexuloisomerase [Paenibacillus aceris]MBP1966591.1 6-phospho-3-hexuloisomerase [Paenibacillus aceris]NHW38828.1 6-phospho-3-hexuloisomerase [Paenibacillus aceris]